jgi:prepilin-type N-terminal cleavage/methylation domain-containing protein
MKAMLAWGTRRAAARDAGLTIAELMVVVVIISILASISGVAYKRYIGRARVGEASAMLAEIAGKQQIYFLEFGSYLPLRADGNLQLNPPLAEAADQFFPMAADSGTLESARTAINIANVAAWPQSWRFIGLRPKANQVYCTYFAGAGLGGAAAIPGPIGQRLLPAAVATTPPWFYAVAACNLNRDATPTYPNTMTLMGLSSVRIAVTSWNDGM